MHDFLTEHHPPDPPIPHPFNNPATAHKLPLDYRSVTDIADRVVAPFYSYGKELMALSLDVRFTMLLLRCLADRPADRPTLEELEQFAESVAANPRNNEPDGFYKAAGFAPPEPSGIVASGSETTIPPPSSGSSRPGSSSSSSSGGSQTGGSSSAGGAAGAGGVAGAGAGGVAGAGGGAGTGGVAGARGVAGAGGAAGAGGGIGAGAVAGAAPPPSSPPFLRGGAVLAATFSAMRLPSRVVQGPAAVKKKGGRFKRFLQRLRKS